jgi:hypothetical protein
MLWTLATAAWGAWDLLRPRPSPDALQYNSLWYIRNFCLTSPLPALLVLLAVILTLEWHYVPATKPASPAPIYYERSGKEGSGSPPTRVRWRLVLPLIQVLLAGALLPLGALQKQTYLTEMNAMNVWDYIPWAHGMLFMIDMPALVLALPFALVVEGGTYDRWAIFLLCVGLFWHWMGLGIDRRRGWSFPSLSDRFPARAATAANVVCLLVSVAAAAFYVRSFFRSAIGPPLLLSGFIWSLAFVTHFRKRVWRDLRKNRG